jgi:hypothetical protein
MVRGKRATQDRNRKEWRLSGNRLGQWKIDPQFLSDEPGAKLQQGESHPPKNLIDFPSNQQPPSGT